MSVINKQVKHVMSDFPYYLGDCLIVSKQEVTTSLHREYEIYRVKVVLRGEVGYLDLITTISQCFKAVGGFYRDISSTSYIGETVCESLAVQAYIEEAY